MPHSTVGKQRRQIEMIRQQFAQGDELTFPQVLPAERIEQALREEKASWREVVFTPTLTLWAFLGQVISADGSCRKAVARVMAWLVSQGEAPCRAETDPYCKARQRLPESLFTRLMRETGRALHQRVPDDWLWLGRRVKLADGTTVSMPDSAANQAEYPQPATQKRGVGFPIARLVVVFCLACGSVLEAALGRYQGKCTGENTLLRTLEDAFEPDDVLLSDRYFSGYFDIAFWKQRGVDVVTRLHQRRKCDMRCGRKLGRNDHVVVWKKPPRPSWMDEATYARMPDELAVREVRVHVTVKGFRTDVVEVVTTLLDARTYTAGALAQLYRMRWHAELDLRSLKTTLGMDVLRCKSPQMVRKEVWAHMLAYNLIRTVMAEAAQAHGCTPRDLSFKGTLQMMSAFAERLYDAGPADAAALHDGLRLAIGAQTVGDRPNRYEPRARKRRPKPYPLLTKPRDVARKQLVA